MLHVIVTMVIKQGRMDDFLALGRALRQKVLGEPGCRAYEYTQEVPSVLGIQEPAEARRITLIERWDSLEALKAHLETPHMREIGPQLAALRETVSARVTQSIE